MAKDRVVVEMASRDQALVQSLKNLERLQRDMVKRLEQMGKAGTKAGTAMKKGTDEAGKGLKKAGQEGKGAFGKGATSGLGSYATGLFTIAAGAAAAQKALAALATERRAAAQALRESVTGTGKLAQLAGGDDEELGRLLGAVRKTQRQTGAPVEDAAALQFALESVGEGKERKFFAGFRQIADPVALAEGASTLVNAFGETETGSIRSVANKLLKASAASKTSIGEFAPAATIAAQTAGAIGGSDEELLSLLAILSRANKSADVAATQISALADVIGSKGFGGEGILAALPKIQRQVEGKSAKEVEEFFGRKEARKAFFALQKLAPQVRELEKGVTAAGEVGPDDLSAQVKRSFLAIPKNRATRDADIAKQRELLAAEDALAVPQVNREAAVSNVRRRSLERGESGLMRLATVAVSRGAEFLGASPETIEKTDRSLVPEFERAFERFMVDLISGMISGQFFNKISNPRGGGLPAGAEHRFDSTDDKFDSAVDRFDRAVSKITQGRGGSTMVPPNLDL